MKLFTFLLVIYSFSISAEEICLTKKELQTAFMFKEITAENQVDIRHTLDKIDLIRGFLEGLNEQEISEKHKVYDEIVNYYLLSIVGVLDYTTSHGLKVDLYKNRISENLKWISDNGQFLPKTSISKEYKRLSAEIAKEP